MTSDPFQLIAGVREALESTSKEKSPEQWAQLAAALGSLYWKHARANPEHQAEDLERSIPAFEAALTVYTWDRFPEDRQHVLHLLGTSYLNRAHGDRITNVERAARAFEEVLAATPRDADPFGWAGAAKSLAFSHREQVWDEDGMEKAIRILEECIDIYRRGEDPWIWADTMRELGLCWRNRLVGDPAENLERAIGCYQQAARIFTRDERPVDWARLRNLLGIAYLFRIRGGRGGNLTTAIHCFHDALEVLTREAAPLEWADLMDSLGLAYGLRSSWDGPDSLEIALSYHEKALEVFTPINAPVKWADAMNNLALTYTQRIHGGRAENLEKAFEAFEQVTVVLTREAAPLKWAQIQHNLGNIRRDRLLGDRAKNLEEAIQFFQRALEIFSSEATPVQWATSVNNLAQTYVERIRGDRESNLEAAIHGFEQVLRIHTRKTLPIQWAQTTHNLASAYEHRIRGNRRKNLEHARALFESIFAIFTRESMPLEWANTMHSLGIIYRLLSENGVAAREQAERSYRSALEVFKPEMRPLSCVMSASQLGSLLTSRGAWDEAAASFRTALQASEILYSASLLRRGRQAELAGAEGLHRKAAYTFARVGRLEEAVLTLEIGRARGLGEALARDRASLERARSRDPLAYSLYCEAVENLRNLEVGELKGLNLTVPEPPDQQLQNSHASFEKALDRIRRIPGYESFLRDPDFKDIAEAVLPGTALVYLLTDQAGSLALLLHRREDAGISIQPVWLDGLRAQDLESLLFRADAGFLTGQVNAASLMRVLAGLLPVLGEKLIGPLSEILRDLEACEVTLVPTGHLALLPLHAAGDACLLAELAVSFSPSARVLSIAQSVAEILQSPRPSLAGIGNPLPSSRPLPNARVELEEIAAFFAEDRRQVFYAEDATEEGLLHILPNASHIHLACHGLFDPDDPLSSRLQLAGGDRLELREILAREPFRGTRLVVLSACQTALTDFLQLPDEVIGLPAGFLQAGAAGVVGTLWPVDDLSTALLMVRFYELHLETRLSPAQALGKAQIWLRDATASEILVWCEGRSRGTGNRGIAAAVALRLGLEEPEYRPFADPFYWAPFVFVGA